MVKKTLAEVQKGFHNTRLYDNETHSENIRVNGHWVSREKYLEDPDHYNSMQFAEGYLEEIGMNADVIHEDKLPESLLKSA